MTTWIAVTAESRKTASYSLAVAAQHNGYSYKCVVKNTAGSVTSSVVALMVN